MKKLLIGLSLLSSISCFASTNIYEGVWKLDGAERADGINYMAISKKAILLSYGSKTPEFAKTFLNCEQSSTSKQSLTCADNENNHTTFKFEGIENSSNRILMSVIEFDGTVVNSTVLIKN